MSEKKLSVSEQNRQIKNAAALAALEQAGGIIARGAWQTGTGNFKKAREIPVGACLYQRDAAAIPPARISRWFIDHPRAMACVALVD